MIHRALVYLLLTRLKNALLDIRRKPSKLIATLLLVGLFVMMITMREGVGGMDREMRLSVLMSILALYILLSVFGGLGEPGPIFAPADVDFVFPAPFRRRDVLVYHLVRHYLQMALLALMYAVFFGAAELPNPVLTYVGILLCLVVCSQLQTAMMLISARVSEQVFGRLRFVTRVVLFGVLGVGVVLAIAGAAGLGDVQGFLRALLEHPVGAVVFYPAIAVGRLAVAPDFGAALLPLLGLLLSVGLSFALVLLFPVNFLETATTRAERKRRAGGGTAQHARSVTSASRIFTGAGAVAWLNALTLKRRLRMVVGALIMLLVMMMFVGARSQGERADGVPTIMIMLVFYPLIVQMPLGFKGHREILEQLKTLPLSPLRMAWGECVFPALVLWLLQLAIVGTFVALGQLEPFWLAVAAIVYPVVDLGVVALSDLFQLGKDRRHLSFLHVTAQMLAMGASIMPAVFGSMLVLELSEDLRAALGAGLLVHAVVVVFLLKLLGRRFDRWEPTE